MADIREFKTKEQREAEQTEEWMSERRAERVAFLEDILEKVRNEDGAITAYAFFAETKDADGNVGYVFMDGEAGINLPLHMFMEATRQRVRDYFFSAYSSEEWAAEDYEAIMQILSDDED